VTGVAWLFPELLLLIVPLLSLYWWRGRRAGAAGGLRISVIIVIAMLAAVPLARIGGRGTDLIVLVDLSHSMPPDGRTRALEIIRLLEQQRGPGDRVGIVSYGRDARIERLPQEHGEATAFVQEVDRDGTDLAAALQLAASLVPRGRPGRLLVLSDGEANGGPLAAAAHEAALRGLPIDVRPFDRGSTADAAVESIDVPGTVDQREPFQFTATVRSNRTIESDIVLYRDGAEISRSRRTFTAGSTQLVFRDVIDRPGVARYRLELGADDDRVPENNAGTAAVRVEAPATILLVNADGRPDNFSRALTAGRLPVRTMAASAFPRELADLLAYRAVVLENVAATQIGPVALENLARFTGELGGGLLVTGGTASFGVGGYFKSPLDEHLPVSMELKNEHRKLSLAMVVALDRSGSMAVTAGDGRTKMDLANLGTCAALETLGPLDEIGVIAVDSAPHTVTPLTSAEARDAICSQVRGIQSMGGGIFVYSALVTAAQMVQESEKGTRHIVLFADAADAEEPGEYQRLLDTLSKVGITVSVIGLGTEADPDAELLKDIAARGQGRAYFAATADDLPRLFAQEAITVARSSFVTEPTPARTLSDLVLLGELQGGAFPSVDGYNLTYLRPGATMGVVTEDEYSAPLFAFWHRGLGRIAALTAEADGKYSGRLNAWPGFQGFAIGVGRWLLGGDPPSDTLASIDRQGGQGIVRLELSPDRARGGAGDMPSAVAVIVPPGERTDPQRLTLSWVGEHTLEARFPLQRAGTYVGAVQLGGKTVLPLAPVSLPYSPEFEPQLDPAGGRRALLDLARITGGVERTAWTGMFDTRGLRNRAVRELVLPLAVLLLVLHVGEVAGRRLLAFERLHGRLRWSAIAWRPTRSRRSGTIGQPVSASDEAPAVAAAPTGAEPPPVKPSVSPLSRAKNRARDRMRR
jgi:Mg-chelatase subunit ChlD/uncharacterized membrane protein